MNLYSENGLYCMFACQLYGKLQKPLLEVAVYCIMNEEAQAENGFYL